MAIYGEIMVKQKSQPLISNSQSINNRFVRGFFLKLERWPSG